VNLLSDVNGSQKKKLISTSSARVNSVCLEQYYCTGVCPHTGRGKSSAVAEDFTVEVRV
jgi:hypothetical protein